jgi:KDO2-lipid IV(A) lauroyltransferase
MRYFLLQSLARLPFGFWYFVSDVLYFLVFKLFGYRKKVVSENLRIAFPHLSQSERNQIQKEFYHNFTDFIVEIVKSFALQPEELRQRVSFSPEGQARISTLLAAGKSALFLSTHHLNWEWVLLHASLTIGMKVVPTYKKLNNAFFEEAIYKMRSKFGAEPVEMKQTYEKMLNPAQPSAFIMIADQTPARSQKKYWTNFMQRPTPFFIGTAILPVRTNLEVFFVHVRKVGRGCYEYDFEPLATPPHGSAPDFSIVDKYAQAVEKAVLAQPQTWLWSHRRWKHSEIGKGEPVSAEISEKK